MKMNYLSELCPPEKKGAYCFYLMKKPRRRPDSEPHLEGLVLEFLDLVYWKLNRILDEEGVSMLEWAFMQRAILFWGEIAFQDVQQETGASKDNVRRAAAFLEKSGMATVRPDPQDGRARLLQLTKRGIRRAQYVEDRFRQELLASLGVKAGFSQRVGQFRRAFWKASGFLESGDLADQALRDHRKKNRAEIEDDSKRYGYVEPGKKSIWVEDESSGELF